MRRRLSDEQIMEDSRVVGVRHGLGGFVRGEDSGGQTAGDGRLLAVGSSAE